MVQGELPRDQKLDVELDVGFSCFIRHLMVAKYLTGGDLYLNGGNLKLNLTGLI